ncbi:hypothetical protein Q7O_001209 [Pectobacterium carotovorum subsp. carotovorum PCCS1]|nr:hypothetical protein [Pectobacterium carotovorum subsp. carotovorum PCCS1]
MVLSRIEKSKMRASTENASTAVVYRGMIGRNMPLSRHLGAVAQRVRFTAVQ